MENFDASLLVPPLMLPASFDEAFLAARPVRVRGDQPSPAVLLVEIDVQGLEP